MVHLDKKTGYLLLEKILTHWTVSGYVLEDESEIMIDFLSKNGRDLFGHALAWRGGVSLVEKKKWLREYKNSFYSEDSNYYDYFQSEMIENIAEMILEVTKDIIEPFMGGVDKNLPSTSEQPQEIDIDQTMDVRR